MNYFVDGFYILGLLARDDPEAFDTLAHTPVRFENNGGDNSSALWFSVPHVQVRAKIRIQSELDSDFRVGF